MNKQEFGTRLAKVMEPAPQEAAPAVVALAPDQLLAKALERDINPDVLGRMMDLYERHERMQAERQYVAAMAAFKADPPKIRKTKHVKYATTKGNTDYHHAPLDEVTRSISIAMSPQGLSFRWRTLQENGLISVTCILQHVGGHSEEVTLQASPDQSGGKNSIQAVGSTVTYLQRYTLLAATGLAAEDQDDDAQAAGEVGIERINADQVAEIKKLLQDTGADTQKFLAYVQARSVESIQAGQHYDYVMTLLKQKQANLNKSKEAS